MFKVDLTPREKIISNLVAAAIVVALGGWGWTKFSEVSTPEATPLAEADLSVDAFIMCKRYVRANLVSPSSADFPLLDFKSVSEGDQQYRVGSYVDSQNGFGSMVRTNWTCTIKHDANTKQNDFEGWSLVDLSLS